MKTHGNGHLFKVGLSQAIAIRIKQLQEEASAKSKGKEFVAAFRALYDRLKKDPHRAGDPTRYLPNLQLTLYVAALRPLIIHYGIHDHKPLVLIQNAYLLT